MGKNIEIRLMTHSIYQIKTHGIANLLLVFSFYFSLTWDLSKLTIYFK